MKQEVKHNFSGILKLLNDGSDGFDSYFNVHDNIVSIMPFTGGAISYLKGQLYDLNKPQQRGLIKTEIKTELNHPRLKARGWIAAEAA